MTPSDLRHSLLSPLATLDLFVRSIRKKGLVFELSREVNYRNGLRLLGWLGGKRSFIGPHTVLVDVINRCELNCLMCYYHSPLYPPRDEAWQNEMLPCDLFEGLVRDLEAMKVDRVMISGMGEPLLHPDLEAMVRAAAGAGLEILVNTAGVDLTEARLDRLLDCGLGGFDLSMHAGEAATYRKVHPEAPADTFEAIRGTLLHLARRRKREGRRFRLIIMNVISALNYTRVPEMLAFAREVGADKIIFKPLLVAGDARSKVGLRPEQIEVLKETLSAVDVGITNNLPEFLHFISILPKKSEAAPRTDLLCKKICHVPWTRGNIETNGDVIGCLYGDVRGERRTVGNLHDRSFREIFEGEAYLDFRCTHQTPAVCYGKAVYHLVF